MADHQTEYIAIHNQRMALVQIIHLWHQIGFPAALLTFGFFFNQGSINEDIIQIAMAAIFASAIVLFVRIYSVERLDASVVRLYPRIIYLELILDYRFYRHYLKRKEGKEKEFIDYCEGLDTAVPQTLWNLIEGKFQAKDFPSRRREHGILNRAAIIMITCFVFIAGYQIHKLMISCNDNQVTKSITK